MARSVCAGSRSILFRFIGSVRPWIYRPSDSTWDDDLVITPNQDFVSRAFFSFFAPVRRQLTFEINQYA